MLWDEQVCAQHAADAEGADERHDPVAARPVRAQWLLDKLDAWRHWLVRFVPLPPADAPADVDDHAAVQGRLRGLRCVK